MANITVRNLDDEVQRRLKQRAADHGRSMEVEARSILNAAMRLRPDPLHPGPGWIRGAFGDGGDERLGSVPVGHVAGVGHPDAAGVGMSRPLVTRRPRPGRVSRHGVTLEHAAVSPCPQPYVVHGRRSPR